MILSDRSIREEVAAGRIVIEPFDDELVQPSSVDVRLDRLFRVFRNHTAGVIDVKKDLTALTELVEMPDDGVFMLHPGEFVLGSTLERLALPDDLVSRIEGKSSLARLGLLIHSSLPGSEPVLVLEDGEQVVRRIEDLVRHPRPCSVVAFDPVTLKVGFHQVTGVFAGPADRIIEVRCDSGRTVCVTGGHNLFTLDAAGAVRKVRTRELLPGAPVAVPTRIPALAGVHAWPGDSTLSVSEHVGSVPFAHAERLSIDGGGDLGWDEVVEVVDTGRVEPVYDLEVRPDGRRIENFVAGHGGVFVANTAGFVDPGFDGHITLELANVASLPITLYPGMKIGQLSFVRMTTPADRPYGRGATGSKYQGQRGPTPSRYFQNFD